MKTFLAILFIVINTSFLLAQEVISSYGMSATNTNASIDNTVGELSINTLNNGNNTLTQGFHQSNLTVLAVDNFDTNFIVKIYPNPSSDIFHIDIPDFTDTSYKIYNINGQLIKENNIQKMSNQIQINDLKNGMYFLALYKNNQRIKTYKIIKK